MKLPPRVERELRWFYLESDGAIGLRTSYGAMVAGIQGLRGGSSDVDIGERRVNAAERARKIQRALERCSRDTQQVLRLTCGMKDVLYGLKLGHLMLATTAFMDKWIASRPATSRALFFKSQLAEDSPPVKLWLSEVRREAEKRLHEAVKEYCIQEEECTSGRLTQSQSWQRSQG